MSPTQEQIARIRESFEGLRPYIEPTSLEFYETLFEKAPELRSLFREDIRAQGMRFMNTLALVLADMMHPDKPSVDYAELGNIHRMLGVRQAHFEPMKEALMEVLANKLGDDLTPALDAAWREAFDAFAERLIKSGNIPE